MVKIVEENFPRGGKKVPAGEKRKTENESLFAWEKPKKQKKDPTKNINIEDTTLSYLNTTGTLSKHTLQEGMTVLASIRKITEHAVDVELPGLLSAKVTIDAISDSLNIFLKKALKSSEISISDLLKSIFHLGQYVPVKLKSVQHGDEQSTIVGSISPTDINHGRRHNTFKKGDMLWAAVVSELDHGYQLDCGVANCRIFLPIKNVEGDEELKIGQPIWCKVHKVENEDAASTLRVGAKRQHIDAVFTDESSSLHSILPGTKVEIFVEKVLKHGLYCKFLDNFIGFVHESQLNPPMQKLSSFKESQMLPAYILFVEETRKITHLSLRGLYSDLKNSYARGDKVIAMVIGKNSTGLYCKLNRNERGWISNRRLLNALGKKSKNFNLLKEKYSIGSKHQCVILSYNHMDRVYICGIEKELVKEKYFDSKDFTVGELVEGVVNDIKPNGIILEVGQFKGFVPNIHLTDSMYSDNLKKKFNIGKKIKARVFSISDKNVIFTLKSNFIKDEKCLSSLENLNLNQIYPALVLKAKSFGLVLSFYNNIEGFVPLREFNFQISQEYKENPSSYYYSGQVINVRVLKTKPGKVIASLNLSGARHQFVEVGANVKGIVTEVLENGLKVFVPKKSVEGFIPVEHLSIDRSLCYPMLKTFKENDRIPDLLVIKSDESGTIMSRREAIAYERCDLRVPKFQNIRKGAILRCSVESVEPNGIFVSSPIKNFTKKIFVKRKLITKEDCMPHFEIQQSVLAKVMEIDQTTETIVLNLKSSNVFDKNIRNSVSLFSEYLADEECLRNFGSQNGWPLNKYAIGEKVLCLVEQISDKGCLVKLPNGCKGLVVPSLCGSQKKGKKVQGIVLGHNYEHEYVELCFNQNIMKHINSSQDGNLPENEVDFTAQKLLTREQYVLTVLRKSGNRQLVYMPLRLCENDSSDSLKLFYEVDSFKIEICGKFGNKLIGFHKKLKQSLDHKFMIKNKRHTKLDISTSSDGDITSQNTSLQSTRSSKTANRNRSQRPSEVDSIEDVNDMEIEEDEIEYISGEEDNESLSDTIEDSGISSGDTFNSSKIKSSDGSSKISENDVDHSEEDESEMEYSKEDLDNEEGENEDELDGEEVKQCEEEDESRCPLPILPSISNFFSAQITNKLDDSSSDDETNELDIKKKKKKLTPAEKAEQAKLEEQRITAIEKELADSESEPKSVEQFERILLADPNSSVMWIKYMSYYLALAEFDKARAVGKKALDTINMTLEDEKFNVWISLLNLENLYGTKESFDKVFEDAVKYNDAFKIYMSVLDMLHESGKHIELEEKIKRSRAKFKQEPEMWLHISKIYYLLGKFNEARNTKNACLKCITNAKQQYNLIVKFAILEFTHGEIDVGTTIFESIVETYPSRVNAWLVYIDQLITKHKIPEARSLLDRAISMKLPLKAIRVIYHKYRSFEEKYGTPESLENFKQRAKSVLQEKTQMTM